MLVSANAKHGRLDARIDRRVTRRVWGGGFFALCRFFRSLFLLFFGAGRDVSRRGGLDIIRV